jgi:hypothetical protein
MNNHTSQNQREAAFIQGAPVYSTLSDAESEFMFMLSTVKPSDRAAVLEGFTAQLSTRIFGNHPAPAS